MIRQSFQFSAQFDKITFRPNKAKASLQAVEKLRQRAQILFGIGGIKRLDTKREVLTKG